MLHEVKCNAKTFINDRSSHYNTIAFQQAENDSTCHSIWSRCVGGQACRTPMFSPTRSIKNSGISLEWSPLTPLWVSQFNQAVELQNCFVTSKLLRKRQSSVCFWLEVVDEEIYFFALSCKFHGTTSIGGTDAVLCMTLWPSWILSVSSLQEVCSAFYFVDEHAPFRDTVHL